MCRIRCDGGLDPVAPAPRIPTMRKLVLISAAVSALALPGHVGPTAERSGAGGSDPQVKTRLACYPKCGHVSGFRRDEVRGILL